MKGVFVTKYGGPEVLEIRETLVPRPEPSQVLVHVKAFGLNFADVFSRFGVYPNAPKPPFIPGLEFSGDVVAVGQDVKLFKGRERVMGYCRNGSHAEYLVVDERLATRIPPAMSYEEGSSFSAAYLTAYHGIVRLANIRSAEKLLVHAAAGGVGLAIVQLAKHLGAEIFGTAGTDEKLELVRSYGAHHVINYVTHDFAEEVVRSTHGYGVDVVMDSVGGETFRKGWQLLAQMGRYVLFGVSAVTGKGSLSRLKAASVYSMMKPIFPPNLMRANKGIFGFNLGTLTGKEGYFREVMIELLKMYELGVLKPHVGKTFRFEQVVEAHRMLQTRQSVGKIVVLVGD
jgi:NADPH:quinone reductase-like Zn-dependent oxidoreductase